MGILNFGAELQDNRLVVKVPQVMPEPVVADLCEYLGVKFPASFPVQQGHQITLLIQRELKSEFEEAALFGNLQCHVECWMRCYPQKIREWEQAQQPKRHLKPL
jgi:hypothetical protein